MARAQAAKDRGVVVFAIGVGEDLDAAALSANASQPAHSFRAPDAEALEAIYRTIAVTVPCPESAFWGKR